MKENNAHPSKYIISDQSPLMDIIREDEGDAERAQEEQIPAPPPPTRETAPPIVGENTVQQAVYLQRTITAPAVLQQHTIPIVPARPILREEESANLSTTTILPDVSGAGLARQTTMSQALELQAGINELMRQVLTSVSSQRVASTTQLNNDMPSDVYETMSQQQQPTPSPTNPQERATTTAFASFSSSSSTQFSNENVARNDDDDDDDVETRNIVEQQEDGEQQIVPSKTLRRRRRCVRILIPLFLLCVVAAIAVGVTVPKHEKTTSSTDSNNNNDFNANCSDRNNAWIKYQDIIGEKANLGLGKSVALSGGTGDGSNTTNPIRLAVGMIWASDNGENSGKVRVYDVTTNQNVGPDLYGATEGQRFGSTVSLSADGNILAVGSPGRAQGFDACGPVRVFRWQSSSSTWVAIGQDGIVPPESIYQEFGATVALSGAGDVIVVGEPANSYQSVQNRGATRVYALQTSDGEEVWVQKGETLYGSAANESVGSFVAISTDGSIIASLSSSSVQVMQYDGSNWTALGSSIVNTKHASYYFGGSIALSANASTLAIGAPFASHHGNSYVDAGNVQVFRWNGTDWSTAGKDIYGYRAYDAWGSSVALSDDGNILAAGANAYADAGGQGTGEAYTRIFKWNESSSSWNQFGVDISSDQKRDQLASVALSDDGSILAIGGFSYDANIGLDAGRVTLFRRNEANPDCSV